MTVPAVRHTGWRHTGWQVYSNEGTGRAATCCIGDIMTVEIQIINDLEESLPLVGISPLEMIYFIMTLVIGVMVVRIVVRTLKNWLIRARFAEILAEFLSRVVRILLLVFVAGTALGFLGLNIGPALISFSVVLGFVLGFALADTLSNIASGFMIAVTKPFKPGDYVTVNGESGTIQSVGISNTEINTVDNKHVIIPNKAVWGTNIINFTYNPTRRVDMEVGVSYDANLDHVIKTTMDFIKADPRILEDPAPQVAVKEMADSAVVLVVRPWTATENYWDVFFDFQKGLKEAYDREGISIPFPQIDLHLPDEKNIPLKPGD